ncbi:MAG: diguanylate cyclase [Acidobacteriota bacterium]
MAGLERILLVGPGEECRSAVRAVAAELSCHVLEAKDSGDALAINQGSPVDVAILNGELPDTPPLAAILKHRSHGRTLVAVIGGRLPDDADDILAAPVDRFELSAMLRIYRKVLGLHEQVAMMQGEIDRLLTRDEATGALRRRGVARQISQEFARADRYGEAISLVVLHVAHLRDLSAAEGALFADDTLREIVQRLEGSLRKCDVVSRVGWDRILVFMPNTSSVGAYFAAEKIRGLASSAPVTHAGKSIAIEVSLGVSTLQDGNFGSADALMAAAEEALHQAQTKGPGTVVLFHPVAPGP